MRVPSVAVMAALLLAAVVVHSAPGQDSPPPTPTLPPTPEIVRMFSEAADRAQELETSESLEDDSDEAVSNQVKRSYEAHPPSPPKQFCIEIRPKNPSQSPFVICEPPSQPYQYQYPQPQHQYPYPYQPDPNYQTPPPVYSPPSLHHKPYQRSDAANAMMMIPLMGDARNAGSPASNPAVAPMLPPPQFPSMGNPSVSPPMLQPPPGPVITQPMPPSASGRSNYPQQQPPYYNHDQSPPVMMQCHAQQDYQQSYHGYQNPVALLQLFLKPSHHHHHHPGYYTPPAAPPAPTEAHSYRAAAAVQASSTPKSNVTSPTPVTANHTSPSDNSTQQGPTRIPILIDGVPADAVHPSTMTKGPHMTPAGSHPESKDIPGITAPGRPNPTFRPGGGAALLKPTNVSTPPALTAPKSAAEANDVAVNMVDGPPPPPPPQMGRNVFNPLMMQQPQAFQQPAGAWARAPLGGNDMIMPENHVISGQITIPIHSDLSSMNGVL